MTLEEATRALTAAAFKGRGGAGAIVPRPTLHPVLAALRERDDLLSTLRTIRALLDSGAWGAQLESELRLQLTHALRNEPEGS